MILYNHPNLFSSQSFDNCNKKVACVKGKDCTSPTNCDGLAKYYFDATTATMHFTLTYKKTAWAAFAQNSKDDDSKMVIITLFLP